MTRISGRVFDASTYGFIADVAIPLIGDQYATYPYVDGSLAARDVSIIWLQENAAGTSYAYVDGSLAARDTSIEWLDDNKANSTDVYDKTYIDGSLNDKADLTYVDASLNIKADLTYVDGSLNAKAESSDVYNKTYIDGSLNTKAESSDVYNKTYIDGSLNTKADADDVYNKTYIDGSLNAKADADDVYNKTYIDGSLNAKVDQSYVDASLNTKADLTYVDGSLATRDTSIEWLNDNKANTSDVYNKTYIDGSLNVKADLTYVDASLVSRDASINNNLNLINDLDASLDLYVAKTGDSMTGDLSINALVYTKGINYDVSVVTPNIEGATYWNQDDNTLNIVTGVGDTIIQVGQEILYKVYNPHAHTLVNGKVVHPVSTGVFTNGIPHVEYAQSDLFERCNGELGFITGDIASGETGFVTIVGKVRDVSTLDVSAGIIYLSADVSGNITNIEPTFPDFSFSLGGVTDSSTYGTIIVSITSRLEDTFQNFWNGLFRESFNADVSTDGTTTWCSVVPKDGNPDMTMSFSDGFSMLDTSPEASINITNGTSTNLQTNYVYVDKTTKVLTVSTSAWPTSEHIKVTEIVVKDASSTNTYGPIKNHNWNDPFQCSTTQQGHLSHITERMRQENAKWDSGCEGSSQVLTGPTPDDVFVQVTSGKVYQMHLQAFDSFDTSTGSTAFVVNHNTTPYLPVTNLNVLLNDSEGNTLNNTSFSFVLWGIVNSTGDDQIMLNLPSGSYAFISPDDAVNDALGYSNYTIPKQFQGAGFLISRFTYTYKNDDWVLYETEDLRGKVPNITAGGGGGGGGVTTFTGLSDTPSSYTGEALKMVRVASGETALEFSSDYYGQTYIDGSLNIKSDLTYVDSSLNVKLDITDFDSSYGALETSIGYNLENKMPFYNTSGNNYDTSINGDGLWKLNFDDDNYIQLAKGSSGPGRPAIFARGDEPYFELYISSGNRRRLETDSDTYVDENFPTQSYVDSSLNAKADKNTSLIEVIDASVITSSSNNKVIECSSTGAFTLTLPNDLDTGFQVTIVNAGTGDVTLDASSLLTTDASVILKSQYAGASAVHKGSGTWYAWGNLE